MWARLQGVGISVRADTALPWPLSLLHKTSQPALSPGLESVSAATCQNKAKSENPVPPVFLLVSPTIPPSPFALVPLPHRWWAASVGRPVTLHLLLDRPMQPASLTNLVCHCVFPVIFQGNSSSIQSGFYIQHVCYVISRFKIKMWQITRAVATINWWVALVDAVPFSLWCLLVTHVVIAGISISRVSSSLSCGWSRLQSERGQKITCKIMLVRVLYKSVCECTILRAFQVAAALFTQNGI